MGLGLGIPKRRSVSEVDSVRRGSCLEDDGLSYDIFEMLSFSEREMRDASSERASTLLGCNRRTARRSEEPIWISCDSCEARGFTIDLEWLLPAGLTFFEPLRGDTALCCFDVVAELLNKRCLLPSSFVVVGNFSLIYLQQTYLFNLRWAAARFS